MGIYRYLLACCVIMAHLTEGIGYFSHTGMFAVFGFYVLSGFLITRVLNDNYRFAFVPFWTNRVLRLYPPYFVLLVAGLALIYGAEGTATFFLGAWNDHPGFLDWIGVVTIFPMGFWPMDWSFRPVPSIWSVGVELLNYAVLYAAVARRKNIALLMAIAAAIFHIVSLWRGDNWGPRYFPFYAALLPFALGALIYFLTNLPERRISTRTAIWFCAPVAANCVLAGLLGGVQETPLFAALFYFNLAFQCLAVGALSRMRQVAFSRLDKLCGDLSYPMFLCHWLVGYVIASLFFANQSRGISLMVATLLVSSAVAYCVCRSQDAIVEPWRRRIRANSKIGHRSNEATPIPVNL